MLSIKRKISPAKECLNTQRNANTGPLPHTGSLFTPVVHDQWKRTFKTLFNKQTAILH